LQQKHADGSRRRVAASVIAGRPTVEPLRSGVQLETHLDRFSTRNGYERPDAEITIRLEAPPQLREAVVSIAYDCGLQPKAVRAHLCSILCKTPDPQNWSDFPNVANEVTELLGELMWFEFYDFVEIIVGLNRRSDKSLADEINRYFRRAGVGWQLINGGLVVRGPEVFEAAVREGIEELRQQGRQTASNELHEALIDMSRRPEPEITGAIQHAMAALECVARDLGASKATLGDLVNRTPGLFPRPVDEIVTKAWGYTSNFGRHLQEGQPPAFEEAELMVGLSGALCRYLARRAKN